MCYHFWGEAAMIDVDDENWEFWFINCEQCAGRPITAQFEVDALYDHWLRNSQVGDAVRDVIGLHHIGTPMRDVLRQIRSAADERDIERILTDMGIIKADAPAGAVIIEGPAAWRGNQERNVDTANRRFADSLGGQSRGLALQAYEVAWSGARNTFGHWVGRVIAYSFIAAVFAIGVVEMIVAIGWARGG
jgi:hypothetical protein